MLNRRHFISGTAAFAATLLLSSFNSFGEQLIANEEEPNILLGRVSKNSACLNTYLNKDATVTIKYGTDKNQLSSSIKKIQLSKNRPFNIEIKGLKANTRYYYQVMVEGEKNSSTLGSFITARKKNEPFVFTITADSHLGTLKHCDPILYQQTLDNLSKDQPDLHFALGDDFRTSKVNKPDYAAIEKLYYNQRHHLNKVFHSIPYYFILGNHELEAKAYDNGSNECLSAWSTKARTQFIPNPVADDFYTGNEEKVGKEGHLQNYYAFEWGDVLFVTLDVFRYSNYSAEDQEMKNQNKLQIEDLTKEERMKLREEREKSKLNGKGGKGEKRGGEGKDQWAFTIGEAQYQWFKSTLEKSNAKYKIVLGHHLMGSCRGGVECSQHFEWGGHSKNGKDNFKQQRPDWPMPIHQLMVYHKVTAFVQGHDHLFARQEKDGLAYITCPMCGDPGYNAYNADAYLSGDKLPNTGHLKFEVSAKDLVMHYVKSVLKKDEAKQGKNGTFAYSWSFDKKEKLQA